MTAPPTGVQEGRVEVRLAPGEEIDVRRRSRSFGWKAAALLVGMLALTVLLGGGANGLEAAAARHTSYGVRPGDHLALVRTLELLDYPVERHLRSYGQLPTPASDHLLVTLDPLTPGELSEDAATRLDDDQVRVLREWIGAGGHWLATWRGDRAINIFGQRVALDRLVDTTPVGYDDADPLSLMDPLPDVRRIPAHGVLSGEATLQATHEPVFARPEHVGIHPGELAEARAERTPLDDVLPGGPGDPDGPASDPLLDSVPPDTPTLRVFESPLPDGWTVMLRFAGEPLAIRRELGEGQLTLVSSALPFSNAGLGLLDLGPAAVMLLHDSADSGRRRILLDEFAHGYLQARGALWWARERGLFDPLVMLCVLLGLLAWRSAVALAPAREPDRRRRRAVEEFVIALGEIARRAGRRARATRNLVDARELLARDRGDHESAAMLRGLRAEIDQAANSPSALRALAARAGQRGRGSASTPTQPPSQETPR